MDRHRNKENRPCGGQNMKITSVFKVKKCLFDSNSEFKSPQSKNELENSPKLQRSLFGKSSPDVATMDDSPFSQFSVRRRRCDALISKDSNDTPVKMDCTTPLKRGSIGMRKLVSCTALMKTTSPNDSVKLAVQKSMQNPDLIGDFSKPCILPVIEGKHPDLKTISPDTVANLLQESESPSFSIIDCRYPYEYDGGHIRDARNVFFKGDVELEFFSAKETSKTILIFYCEFSSERAPSMMRFLRQADRDLNKERYPHLFYPELYVMEGGYKAFYASFRDLCVPQTYKTMLDKECSEKMSYFRNYCKNFSSRSKRRKIKSRTNC